MDLSKTNKEIIVELDGRDRVIAHQNADGSWVLNIVGCFDFLNLFQEMKSKFGKEIHSWPTPKAKDHASLLLRELIMKANGQWQLPYEHEELCHCRAVSTHTVDQAIIAGAHTSDSVSRVTSASTACSTCRPQVEALIKYRLGN